MRNSTIITGPAHMGFAADAKRWFVNAIVEIAESEEACEKALESNHLAAYVVPLFWSPTSGLDLVKRAISHKWDVSKVILLLPESMKDADEWTRTNLPPVPNFVYPQEADLLKAKLSSLLEAGP